MNAKATGEQVVVIVGAGLAGGNAAVTLREEGWRGRIVLLGTEPGIPFGRPPLSKTYLRGEEDLSAWYVKPADWCGDHDVELRTGSTVRQVDTALKQLRLASGETVDYDKLVLCTGGRNRNLAVPGANLPGVYQLRTVAECDAIRQVARPGARAVVVGMGFIGSEVAASLRQMGLEVTGVLRGEAPLAAVLGNEVAAVYAAIHREHGVHLVTNDQVIGFEGGTRVERVLTAKGAQLACDLVVVGIGIAPTVDARWQCDCPGQRDPRECTLPNERARCLCRRGCGQPAAPGLRQGAGGALQQRRKARPCGGPRRARQHAGV